jgi:uncharacterized protein involved in response to NO
MENKVDNPYKLLFSLGVVSALFGVMQWPLFSYHLLSFYPKQAHLQIMFFGFFWSFVAGFLMTAIPRMTGSTLANRYEVAIASGFVVAQILINYTYFNFSPAIFLLQLSFTIYFILPRVLEKRKIPFDGFLFMPFAFLMAFVGVFAFYYSNDTRYLKVLAGEAFLTNLIMGLGSRLIPALSRLPNAFMHPGMAVPLEWKKTLLKVILLNMSFILEILGYIEFGYILRLAVVGYISVQSFGLFKKGSVFSMTALGLKMSVVFFLISYINILFLKNYSIIAHSHWLYIGGFTLLTILIATRVTLAHSQTSLDYELKSRLLLSIIVFFFGSVFFRWISNYNISGLWINLSLTFFMCGLLLWLFKHLLLVRSSIIQKD